MIDLVWVLLVVVNILCIRDVLQKFSATVPRALWIVCIVALPWAGAAFWYYVQYWEPRRRRLQREERERLRDDQ